MVLECSDIRLGTEVCRDMHQTHPERSAEELQCVFPSPAIPGKVSSVCDAVPPHILSMVFEHLCLQELSSHLPP